MAEEQTKEIMAEDSLTGEATVAMPETGEPTEVKEKKTAKASLAKGKKKKRKERRNVGSGCAYISASYNNTIISLTDQKGDVIAWASAGSCGFRGPKKSTPYAAQMIVKTAVDKAKAQGLNEVNVFVKGVGTGRESAVRALNANGLNIIAIKDMTPIPHNGCRPRKARRI
jgi:small subunit ribosomal protein S11